METHIQKEQILLILAIFVEIVNICKDFAKIANIFKNRNIYL